MGVTLTEEEKLDILKTSSPYGHCVWHCDNDFVDHQSVVIEFENGCTATHNMIGATSRPCRTIHIKGTNGEIQGVLEDGYFVVRHPDATAGHEYSEERVTVNVTNDSHGGGDLLLVEDFIKVLKVKRHRSHQHPWRNPFMDTKLVLLPNILVSKIKRK